MSHILNPENNLVPDGSFERPIIDSRYSFEEATNHPECPEAIKDQLALCTVKYLSFDNNFHEGQLVVHQELQKDIEGLFAFMLALPDGQKFMVEKVVPIVAYKWDDEASMSANNTSAFNYRKIAGQDKLSLHAYGVAIDLNPRLNPVVKNGQVLQPINGRYNITEPGTLFTDHPIIEFMKARGWEWGGDWTHYQDYQHFQKQLKS